MHYLLRWSTENATYELYSMLESSTKFLNRMLTKWCCIDSGCWFTNESLVIRTRFAFQNVDHTMQINCLIFMYRLFKVGIFTGFVNIFFLITANAVTMSTTKLFGPISIRSWSMNERLKTCWWKNLKSVHYTHLQ